MLQEPDIPREFNSRAELEEAADFTSKKAPEEFQHTVYLYFLARYLVVVFETSFSKLPIQVWNEYRNAFDHYIRHLTKAEENGTDHLKKLEGHVQRAVLDVSKLLCHTKHDRLRTQVDLENRNALRMVDNGEFFPELEGKFETALLKFQHAKMVDLSLGEDAKNNRDILGKYLDAFYGIVEAELFWKSRRQAIQTATATIQSIAAHASHQSSATHIRDSLIAKLIWLGVGALLYAVWEYFSQGESTVLSAIQNLWNWIGSLKGK